MRTSITLAFCLAITCHVHSGLIPAFSADEVILEPAVTQSSNYSSELQTLTSELYGLSYNVTTTADQIIIPKAAVINSSDILLFSTPDTTTENEEPMPSTSELFHYNMVAIENEIVVPKEAIDDSTLRLALTTLPPNDVPVEDAIVVPKEVIENSSLVSETDPPDDSPCTAETVPADESLAPISLHPRSIDSAEYPDTSSALFEKYDKWNGTGAITSQEKRDLERTARLKRNVFDETTEQESAEVEFRKSIVNDAESNSAEINRTEVTDTMSVANNVTNATSYDNLDTPVKQQLIQEDESVNDDQICAVDKEDLEATQLVTLFWRVIFCVIFVIIIVYPIYSYTKIYCQKRRRDAETVSTKRMVESDDDGESSITNESQQVPPAAANK